MTKSCETCANFGFEDPFFGTSLEGCSFEPEKFKDCIINNRIYYEPAYVGRKDIYDD